MKRVVGCLVLAICACDAPVDSIETGAENLGKGAIAAAPAQVLVAQPFARPQLPTLVATATSSVEQSNGEVQSITVHVTVTGATQGEVAVEFVAPTGTVYQRQAQVTANTPYRAQTFDFVLPVSGTWIQSMGLLGAWTANVMWGASELTEVPFAIGQ